MVIVMMLTQRDYLNSFGQTRPTRGVAEVNSPGVGSPPGWIWID